MINPFEEKMLFMGYCKGIDHCPHFAQPSFFPFTNTPEVPAVEEAKGKVLLIAGDRTSGKTVYGHRLLHEYHAGGLHTLDLLHLAYVVKESPVRRHQVLCELHKEIDDIDPAVLQTDDDLWGERLCGVLRRSPGKLAVRLPGVVQKGTSHDDIAAEIFQYATAAHLSDNVFIYEYLTDTYPADWYRLLELVEKNHDVPVMERVVTDFSADDLWTYVKGVMDRFPGNGITLAPGMPECLHKTFSRGADVDGRPIRLDRTHGFMRHAFNIAIEEHSTEVSDNHVLSAVFRVRGAA